MNRRLTPDQRAGLSVAGLVLVVIALGLGITSYHLFGVPQWPMAKPEMYCSIGTSITGLLGFALLYKGTDVTSR